jgi:hypothetical protein
MDTEQNIERLNQHISMERAAALAQRERGLAAGGDCAGQQAVNQASDRPTVESLGNILSARNESEEPSRVRVALSGSAADTLRCLFFHGPTWDGNVPSKSARDELVNMGLAARGNGWQWLTRAGIEACFANKIHDEKDRRESRERKRRHQLEDLARQVLG